MDDTTLRIERMIDATPQAVFDAWTTADAMQHWYRERPEDEVEVVELDLRVGGRYRIKFGTPRQAEYVETGEYLEVDRPRRLVVRETMATPGGVAWADTLVTVTFDDVDGKTRLVLVHEQLPSRETRDDAAGGWPGFIDRLAALVAR